MYVLSAIRSTLYAIRATSDEIALYICRAIITYVERPLQISSFMQNKANLPDDQMNVNKVLTKDYENQRLIRRGENKPNTNPIQTQSNPISPPHATKQTQNKPKQSQFQTENLLIDRAKSKLLNFHPKNSLTNSAGSLEYGVFGGEREFSMKSFMAKKEQVEHKWLLVDAEGAILGRMAAKIAPILMGKTKPTYTAHVDTGDYVIVVNADKVKVTGKKAETKQYDYYTHFPGGHKFVSFADMMTKKPEKVVELAVRRMLPKSKLGRAMLKKLKVYRGLEHNHQAQKPEKIELF